MMGTEIWSLLLGLVVILLSCELFTNGIEWLGKRLSLGDGVIGSIFSAVGTCLPETMVPIIAILFTRSAQSVDVGIGAIVGAPFMLSTLAFFVTGCSVVAFRKKRKTGLKLLVNHRILKRDLGFFIVIYSIGVGAALIDSVPVKKLAALLLVCFYILYIYLTIRSDHEGHGHIDTLYMSKFVGTRPRFRYILFQVALALTGIIVGAKLFVMNIESIAHHMGIAPLVLAIIITPIATELPEKFNSILWIRRKKDTLAMGNITGAMVFQSCIPVAIGILTTPWRLDATIFITAALALSSAALAYIWLMLRRKLTAVPLLAGGVFYIVFILYVAIYILSKNIL